MFPGHLKEYEKMTADKVSLELKNRMSELDFLCRILEEFCISNALSKKSTFELTLVMDEIFTNIVSYGYGDREDHHIIKIDIKRVDKDLIIRVEDDGVPFDPTAAGKPDMDCALEHRQIGGLGLHLINQLMNDIFYERTENKNILIMKKSISGINA